MRCQGNKFHCASEMLHFTCRQTRKCNEVRMRIGLSAERAYDKIGAQFE